jgi:TetR/AcrR family transcriptional repressor of nem operon
MGTSTQIVEAADRLFYEKGFEHTSFTHIADAVQLSKGNFYYHFKTKDELLDAVIAMRLERTRQMLAQWESEHDTPADRVMAFFRILVRNRSKIMRHGCPAGTLCTELAKLEHLSSGDANEILMLFHDWLRQQFARMGYETQADALALHVLARSQGVATLAQAFHDKAFIDHEVAQLERWLNDLDRPAPHNARRRPAHPEV